MSRHRWISLLGATAVAAALLGCGKEDPVRPPPAPMLVPEPWAGLWEITLTSRECGSDSILAIDILVDSVCTGGTLVDFLGLEDDEVELTCTGTWNDTDLAATCSGSSQSFGCDFDISGTVNATANDSSFAGVAHLDLRLNCDGDLSSDCVDAELVARRLGPEPASCPPQATSSAPGVLETLKRRLEALSTVQP